MAEATMQQGNGTRPRIQAAALRAVVPPAGRIAALALLATAIGMIAFMPISATADKVAQPSSPHTEEWGPSSSGDSMRIRPSSQQQQRRVRGSSTRHLQSGGGDSHSAPATEAAAKSNATGSSGPMNAPARA